MNMDKQMSMDKQELFKEFAEMFLAELKILEKGRVQVAPQEMVKKALERVINPPQQEEEFDLASMTSTKPPEIVPEFPRLLLDPKGAEYICVKNYADWAPYHDWYNIFPPQQPASRPVETTLEAEVEKLHAAGVKERPKEAWERRKQKGPSNLWWETGRSF